MNHPENEIEKSKQIMRLTAPQFADQCVQWVWSDWHPSVIETLVNLIIDLIFCNISEIDIYVNWINNQILLAWGEAWGQTLISD